MKKHETLFYSFLKEIEQKIPLKTEIVNNLARMLNIDEKAVYRRLSGDVPLTFHEAVTISKQLDISLDNIDISNSSPSFKPDLIEYINLAESDFALLNEMTTILNSLKDVPDAEGGEITNLLPQPLYLPYESLFRLDLFRWKYQFNTTNKVIPYKDIFITDKLRKKLDENVKCAKYLQTNYFFDNQIFSFLVTDLKYFYSAGLITNEELRLIKLDLLKVLEDIDILSQSGIFKETQKRIDIYISNVKVDTSYVYIDAPNYQLTIVKAFLINGIATRGTKTFEELKRKVQSLKRQSVLITGSSEKERIKFLKEQCDAIKSLSQLKS